MVLSEGKSIPSLLNSHLTAETPTWAKGSDSSCFLIEMINCLTLSLVLLGFLMGTLGLSLYQSKSPLRKRLSHLKNQYFERLRSVYIDFGDSPLTYRKIACFLVSSSIWPSLCLCSREVSYQDTYSGYRCPEPKNGLKSYRCPDPSGLSMSWTLALVSRAD